MPEVLNQIIHNCIYSSICILLLCIFKPILLRYFNKNIYLGLWLIPLFSSINPVSFAIGTNILPNLEAIYSVISKPGIRLFPLGLIWGLGFIFSLFHSIIKRIKTTRLLMRTMQCADPAVLEALEYCKQIAGIKQSVEICFLDVGSPFVFYGKNATIILPSISWEDFDTLAFVLFYELCHIKHYDIWIKSFGRVVQAIYWWNPLIYLVQWQLNEAIELACDHRIAYNLTDRQKLTYGNTILYFAGKAYKTIYGAVPFGHPRTLQRRIKSIAKPLKNRSFITYLIATTMIFGSFFTIREYKNTDYSDSKLLSSNIVVVQRIDGLYDIYEDNNLVIEGIDLETTNHIRRELS